MVQAVLAFARVAQEPAGLVDFLTTDGINQKYRYAQDGRIVAAMAEKSIALFPWRAFQF